MQAYGASFAKVYNLRWNNFAQQFAPRLQAYYEKTPVGQHNQKVLDLCCGTGQLALYFLDRGYEVTGLDLSPAMLDHARANTAPYLLTGQARFIEADASNFLLPERFGLAASTFDALNHLPGMGALEGCFRSVHAALDTEGVFVFDLNTRLGLSRWTNISVEDSPDAMIVLRAVYDAPAHKALMHISGFLQTDGGLYERFEETAFEIGFDLNEVRGALLAAGFRSVRFTRTQDLNTPVEEPEREQRIVVIAEK